MKIGIIGTGRMGSALGKAWAQQGHEVFLGSRDPARGKEIATALGNSAQGGSIAEAAHFGDVVLLATLWAGVKDALQAAGNLADKTLIDCTLPLVDRQLAVDGASSGAEEVSKLAPGAYVVKAFHTINYEQFANPLIGATNISMFYCGNDATAKALVKQLATEMGLDPRRFS